MSNHLHLIISAKEDNVSAVLGDFKKFTSKKLIRTILEHPGESRKEWMVSIFKETGEKNSRNTNYLPIAIGMATGQSSDDYF